MTARWKLAAAAVAAFAGIVVAAYTFGTSGDGMSRVRPDPARSSSAAASRPAETWHVPSSSPPAEESEPGEEPAPTEPAFPQADAARETAAAWAASWLAVRGRTGEQWRQNLIEGGGRRRVTGDLAELLTIAEPHSIVGQTHEVTVTPAGDDVADADVLVVQPETVPAVPVGTLTLELVFRDGRWLVSAVDWAAA